jgi:hypothetical protein
MGVERNAGGGLGEGDWCPQPQGLKPETRTSSVLEPAIGEDYDRKFGGNMTPG